jgi:hypothetical protein
VAAWMPHSSQPSISSRCCWQCLRRAPGPKSHRARHLPDELVGELLDADQAADAERHRGMDVPPAQFTVDAEVRVDPPESSPLQPLPRNLADFDHSELAMPRRDLPAPCASAACTCWPL